MGSFFVAFAAAAAAFADQSYVDGNIWLKYVEIVCEPKDCLKDLHFCSHRSSEGGSRTETKETHK